VFFAGGRRGSIEGLWRSLERRGQVLDLISATNADVLIIPGTGGDRAERLALAKWVQAASERRPGIVIMINSIHPAQGRQHDARAFQERTLQINRNVRLMVRRVSRHFEDVQITVLGGGFAAAAAKSLEETGDLEGQDPVIRDRLGHGSALVYTAQAILWAQALYDLSSSDESNQNLDMQASDLKSVLDQVAQIRR
jgi:hypothetical protein